MLPVLLSSMTKSLPAPFILVNRSIFDVSTLAAECQRRDRLISQRKNERMSSRYLLAQSANSRRTPQAFGAEDTRSGSLCRPPLLASWIPSYFGQHAWAGLSCTGAQLP